MYGGLGKSAKKLLKMISNCARDPMLMWPYHQIIQNLKGEIAIFIQRGNAIAILAGYNRAIGKPAKLPWEEVMQLHKSIPHIIVIVFAPTSFCAM